ncbi:hypothetical protein Tco_0259077, partial [Tanacetum coccineum]
MLEFCGEKGIKQEFSNARTPHLCYLLLLTLLPLLPSMLLVATNPIAGHENAAVAPSQPSSSPPIPIPTPPPIPIPTPPPIPTPTPPPILTPTSPPPLPPETEPTTDEHIYEVHSPVYHHFSSSQAQAPSHMPMNDLLQAVPKLISRIDS